VNTFHVLARLRSKRTLLGLALAVFAVALTGGSAFASPSGSAAQGAAAGSPPVNTIKPVVSGIARDGQLLTTTTGTWSGTLPITYAYRWLRCDTAGANCTQIANAIAQSYRLTSADVGSTIRSRVTATNAYGSSSAQSAQTAVVVAAPPHNLTPPVVSGTAQVGKTLTSSTGTWSGTQPLTYAYQWLRCDAGGANCASIQGATAASYVVASTDKGSTLRSRVTATNKAGSSSAQSAATAVVTASSTSIYWGAYMDGNDTYDYLYGGDWGDAPWDANTWNRFESNAGKHVSIVHWGLGTPWANDFNHWRSTFELVRARGELSAADMTTGSVPLHDIASGLYDAPLRTWVQQAAAYAHPFFLILDVEMNGTWEPYSPGVNGNTPADFVSMWRHVHDLSVQAGATNITWVWAPNVDPLNLFTSYDQLYPGDAYVDWTGFDGFNMDGTSSFSWLYGPSYNKLLQLAPAKPIMVTQVASVEGGNGKAQWITDALSTQIPQSFPQMKAVVWFNWRFYKNGTWMPYEIESSASSQSAFASGIAASYYAPGGAYGNLPLLKKINPP
jgi:Glycosyl hydrolase family 26